MPRLEFSRRSMTDLRHHAQRGRLRAHDRQHRGQERHRRGDRDERDQHAADAHRADERQREQHQAAPGRSPPSRPRTSTARPAVLIVVRSASVVVRSAHQLLAVAVDDRAASSRSRSRCRSARRAAARRSPCSASGRSPTRCRAWSARWPAAMISGTTVAAAVPKMNSRTSTATGSAIRTRRAAGRSRRPVAGPCSRPPCR